MFSIYLVLGIGCSHAKFNHSKGMEGEIGAGSQIKELKQTLLFQTFCQQLTQVESLKPRLHALKNRHGKPNFWHRADDFKARHAQFSTCKRIDPKCNVVPVLKILGVPRLPPGGGPGTGKRRTVPKIWRAVPIFEARLKPHLHVLRSSTR